MVMGRACLSTVAMAQDAAFGLAASDPQTIYCYRLSRHTPMR
jgi:hypothetical protein